MGSGETAPTMAKVHRLLLSRSGPPPVPAVMLDTPYGFQENAPELAERAQLYFRQSIGVDLEVAVLGEHAAEDRSDDRHAHEHADRNDDQQDHGHDDGANHGYILAPTSWTRQPARLDFR